MKKLKKLAVLLLAVVMTMAMNMTVFADGEATGDTATAKGYTLTLTGTTTGHTYEAYQIFTGDLSDENNNMVLSNVKWGTGVTYTGTESAADVAKALGDKNMTIEQLEGKLTLTTPVKTVESSKDSTEISGLAAGYYLVKDQDGTQDGKFDAYTKFIVKVVGDTEAKVKSDVPTVEKKVKDANDSDGTTSDWQDSADYDIGDDVPFQITGTMPDNIGDYTKYTYKFTDTMTKGLTYKKDAKITIGNTDVTKSFIANVTNGTDGSTVVTWTCDNLKGIEGVTVDASTKVVVTYSATLNKDAVIGAAGNPNTVNLTYSNNPNKGGEGKTGKTPDDKNIVFTYKTVVNKVDQGGKSLKGAAFKLEKKVKTADGITMQLVKEFTAGEDTTFTFTGLDDGEYKLTETTTPSGYNTIAPVEFTISATHEETSDDPKLTDLSVTRANGFKADTEKGSLTTNIVNEKGSNLPSTGGVGTRMFYVFGGCLVAAAVVLLALKKRREA